jgi:hypothetical protein
MENGLPAVAPLLAMLTFDCAKDGAQANAQRANTRVMWKKIFFFMLKLLVEN